MCLPQPACFEHLLSIITRGKAGGEGAQGSSAWQYRSHHGAHFSLICCGTLDARWNLRDEIWAISCFSSFWTVINTIKKAEQWGFPTPLLSRPISKAVAEMPSAAFVDPGLRSPCSLLSNRKAEQIKHKLSLEGWRRGIQGRALPQPLCPLCSLHCHVPCVKPGEQVGHSSGSSPAWIPAPALLGTTVEPGHGPACYTCHQPFWSHTNTKHTGSLLSTCREGLFVPKAHDKLITDRFDSNQLVKKRKWRKRIN